LALGAGGGDVSGWSETNLISRVLTFKKVTFYSHCSAEHYRKCSLVAAISRRSGYHGHFPSGKANDELMTVVARVTHQLRAMGQPLGSLPDGSSH
jgi:hypothetical protein